MKEDNSWSNMYASPFTQFCVETGNPGDEGPDIPRFSLKAFDRDEKLV